MKNNYLFNNLKYLINTSKFKLILLLIIINTFYGGFVIAQPGIDVGYINTLLKIYCNPYFIMILLITITLNIFYVYDIFSKNSEYVIRLGSKKVYFKKLIDNVLFSNLIIFFIQLLLVLTVLNIFYNQNIGIQNIYLGVNNLFYFLFFLFRVFILMELLTIICLYLIELISKQIIFVVIIFICVSIPIGENFLILNINNNIIIPTYIATYFKIYPYNSFFGELSSSLIFILFMNLIIFILSKIKFRKKRVVPII